ncbi:MAG: YceI family protein [Vicingus serpentipes]|nr:YceI family protein [Vicingus serpentipes]
MKQLNILLFIFITSIGYSQNLFKATSGEISFFSTTPMEDIDATNKLVKALINADNNEIVFMATIIGFHFKKPLMEEHFNENYMESDKYKIASFKGKILTPVDYNVDGKYNVKARGTLNIHGVDQVREISGELLIKNNHIELVSAFDVKLADHNIKIPKLVMKNIAEMVTVKLNVNFEKK